MQYDIMEMEHRSLSNPENQTAQISKQEQQTVTKPAVDSSESNNSELSVNESSSDGAKQILSKNESGFDSKGNNEKNELKGKEPGETMNEDGKRVKAVESSIQKPKGAKDYNEGVISVLKKENESLKDKISKLKSLLQRSSTASKNVSAELNATKAKLDSANATISRLTSRCESLANRPTHLG